MFPYFKAENTSKIDALTTSLAGKIEEMDKFRESIAENDSLLSEKSFKISELDKELQEIYGTIHGNKIHKIHFRV